MPKYGPPSGVLLLLSLALALAFSEASSPPLPRPIRARAAARRTNDDLPGTVVHSWLANSFAAEKGHESVPVNVTGIGVAADGTVFSAGVAEAFGGAASYKSGRFVTKYDYDSGWGSSSTAIAADDDFVYIATGAGLFRTRRGDGAYNKTPVLKGDFHGVALRNGKVYLSDFDRARVLVLAKATMKPVRSFASTRPGPLAVGADGRIWVIRGKVAKEPYLSFYTGGSKIVSISADGRPGPEIADFENPCALAVDAKGRLLVGGLNRHSQIWIYDVARAPRKVDTFGAYGGIFSGVPGQYGPRKFHWTRGLGLDGAGNLYVASVYGTWYNVTIEAYDSSGRRLWEVHGLGNWLDTAAADPADENRVYTKENMFTMDWARPAGHEQSLAGFTVNRFQYPTDPRVVEGHGPGHRLVNGIRRIGGKPFLFCGAQGTLSLEIYRFQNGYVAAPCGFVGGASIWRPNGGKRWPEDAESFIWTDANRDGHADPGEFASVKKEPRWGSMHLDAQAGIWQCSEDKLWHLPCEGLDQNGNPIYRRTNEVSYQNPKAFPSGRLRRLFYVPKEDTLILGGSPESEQNACDQISLYDHWSDAARRTERWTIRLPLDDKTYTPDTGYGGGAPQALCACGKYLFVAYGYGYIRVHALEDGAYVGTLRPDINGFRGAAQARSIRITR